MRGMIGQESLYPSTRGEPVCRCQFHCERTDKRLLHDTLQAFCSIGHRRLSCARSSATLHSMCELLGMSANVPTDICFSFAGLM
jgi:hypothetical protein